MFRSMVAGSIAAVNPTRSSQPTRRPHDRVGVALAQWVPAGDQGRDPDLRRLDTCIVETKRTDMIGDEALWHGERVWARLQSSVPIDADGHRQRG